MKTFLSLLLFAATASAQAPGTVDVASAITATAGTLSCVGTATVGQTTSLMHLKCSEGSTVLHEGDYTVTSPGSTVYSIGRGQNMIVWLLTKGSATPDQWQVTANGVGRSGTF